jgi:2-hydroxyacyl-CoA lyase 1
MDAVSLLRPHTKFITRPTSRDPAVIVEAIRNAYRIAWYGRPGPTFVDLPTELIMEATIPANRTSMSHPPIKVLPPPQPAGDLILVKSAAGLLRSASAPLVIIGKGAAYSRAEDAVRRLVSVHNLPFLPTPMAKGLVSDSHPMNTTPARSTALKHADVILLLGARLNWILHHGEAPKYRPDVKIIQVDISPEELGRANTLGQPSLSIFGDIPSVVSQLDHELGSAWVAFPQASITSKTSADSNKPSFLSLLAASAAKNKAVSDALAHSPTKSGNQLTYQRAYHIIKSQIDALSPPSAGDVIYVSEGANTMDISRTSFPLEHPRSRLDAGTYATMGVGMGYAIAAWSAYNLPTQPNQSPSRRKKIVALEGDSAFGFSAMEIETMARHGMDVLIIVMNNSGIYKGDASDEAAWRTLQRQTHANDTSSVPCPPARPSLAKKKGLRSTSLLYETRYEKMAEMVGGRGWFVRTEEELANATREAFQERERVCLLNVVIDPGLASAAQFGWMERKEKEAGGGNSSSSGGGGGQSKL